MKQLKKETDDAIALGDENLQKQKEHSQKELASAMGRMEIQNKDVMDEMKLAHQKSMYKMEEAQQELRNNMAKAKRESDDQAAKSESEMTALKKKSEENKEQKHSSGDQNCQGVGRPFGLFHDGRGFFWSYWN